MVDLLIPPSSKGVRFGFALRRAFSVWREDSKSKRGIVVVENTADASSVIAINSASSVDADVFIVSPLAKNQRREVQTWIQAWRERGDTLQLQTLKDAVSSRVGTISFGQFECATFFTEGPPYSFVLENVIPCSHVDLSLRPDLFVINNILFEFLEPFHSAVLFSPVFFSDEETERLRTLFIEDIFQSTGLSGLLTNYPIC